MLVNFGCQVPINPGLLLWRKKRRTVAWVMPMFMPMKCATSLGLAEQAKALQSGWLLFGEKSCFIPTLRLP
jgi:hypothetical protein